MSTVQINVEKVKANIAARKAREAAIAEMGGVEAVERRLRQAIAEKDRAVYAAAIGTARDHENLLALVTEIRQLVDLLGPEHMAKKSAEAKAAHAAKLAAIKHNRVIDRCVSQLRSALRGGR